MFTPKRTPQEIDRIRGLWADGYSASDISTTIDPTGSTSRAAIIGLVYRHKMKAGKKRQVEFVWTAAHRQLLIRSVAAGASSPEIAAELDPSGVLTANAVRSEASRLGLGFTTISHAPPVRPVRVRVEPPRPSRPCVLTKLTATSCRWPIGDDAPFLFCNETADDRSSYCPAHHAFSLR